MYLYLSSVPGLNLLWPGAPNLQDPRPGDLRWSWCDNNRNKKVKVKVTHSCPTPHNPGQNKAGLYQNNTQEWVAFSFSRGSSQPRDWTQVSCVAARFFTSWTTREALEIKCKINVKCLNHPQTIPPPCLWKNCFPWNWSRMPNRFGTAVLRHRHWG